MSRNDEFTRELLDSIGGPVADRLSAQNVVSKDQALDAMASLSPVLLGSLKRKQEEGGGDGLEDLLARAGASEDHLDDLDGTLENQLSNGGPDLGGILDSNTQEQTASALSQKLGISGGVAKKLIPMLAPIILSMLMKKGKQHSGTNTRSGGIGAILDRDGDGSMLDDIAGMVLGGNSGGQKRGFLQMLLAFFFRRK